MLEFKMHKLFVLTLTIHLATKVAGGIIALLLYYDMMRVNYLFFVEELGPPHYPANQLLWAMGGSWVLLILPSFNLII
jgi:hypothetical protein